jgi:hypothetical protein
LLAGKDLDLNAFIPSSEPPEHYGGPCPKTPFEMNRRFLAIARFNADPEPAIRAHAKRIAKRESIDLDSPLRLAAQATLCVRALLDWRVFRDCPPGAPPRGGRPGGGAVAT